MAAGGAMGGDPMAALQPMIDQSVQAALASQGGAPAGGGGGGAKAPKVDVGVELKDIKQQLAKLMDVMGITMTPSEVYGEEEQAPQDPMAAPAPAPEAAGGALGAINPIAPMKAAEWEQGEAIAPPEYINDQVEGEFKNISNMAAAMLTMKHAK